MGIACLQIKKASLYEEFSMIGVRPSSVPSDRLRREDRCSLCVENFFVESLQSLQKDCVENFHREFSCILFSERFEERASV